MKSIFAVTLRKGSPYESFGMLLRDDRGLPYVESIKEGGAAAQDIQVGDRLLMINGYRCDRLLDPKALLGSISSKVDVVVVRGLGTAEEDIAKSAAKAAAEGETGVAAALPSNSTPSIYSLERVLGMPMNSNVWTGEEEPSLSTGEGFSSEFHQAMQSYVSKRRAKEIEECPHVRSLDDAKSSMTTNNVPAVMNAVSSDISAFVRNNTPALPKGFHQAVLQAHMLKRQQHPASSSSAAAPTFRGGAGIMGARPREAGNGRQDELDGPKRPSNRPGGGGWGNDGRREHGGSHHHHGKHSSHSNHHQHQGDHHHGHHHDGGGGGDGRHSKKEKRKKDKRYQKPAFGGD